MTSGGSPLDDEWEQVAQSGLINVFYSQELTPRELEDQLSDRKQGAESVDDAASAIRPWLEDRSFQLALYRLRGHLDPEVVAAAFTAIVDAAILQIAHAVDREFLGAFDETAAADAPAVFALGPLARSEMTMGDALALAVEPGTGEGAARASADLRRFQNDWTKYFIRGLRRLFHNDFPCRFTGTLAASAAERRTSGRRLRP